MSGKPDAQKRGVIVEGLRQGLSHHEIVDEMGASSRLIYVVEDCLGGIVPRAKTTNSFRLSLAEREQISIGLSHGLTFRAIATGLDRSVSTICREVNNNGGRRHYLAWSAHETALVMKSRPKVAKLVMCKRLRKVVQNWLKKKYSPRQISERLMAEFPDDPEMRISHEAIYQSLFVQSRGALKRELTECLRTGRTIRRSQHRGAPNNNRIKDMIMISQRPGEASDRAIPGHWEGDLIMGKNNRSAIGTLVERNTRYVMLMKLPTVSAEVLRKALMRTVKRLPTELFKTLTWDQGTEMAQHARFSVDSGVDVYFCDPHSPWQRGSNENTNGLLRQYFPKGTDLSVHSQRQLDRVARELNDRPRQTLGFMKPAEKLDQLLR
jgi:transposase, IS30 family